MIFKMFILLLTLPIYATTFQLQTVDQQIAEADGIMMGHFLRKKSIQLENGTVATQMVFKINREYGLQSDQFGMDEVIVHYPGGKIGGVTKVVEGVPSFVSGERVALLIRSVENRFWGLNLAMGAYKEINYGKEIMLVNSLVPHDQRVGQIRLDDFEKSVKNIKGAGLKIVLNPALIEDPNSDRAPASLTEVKTRSIASKTDKGESEEPQPSISTFWLVAVLAFLGGIFRFSKHTSPK